MWTVDVRRRAELAPDELAEQRALGLRAWAASEEPDARYPFGITWAPPTWLALVRDPATSRLIGRAGLLERRIRWGDREVPAGGLSSVSTDPEYRGQGVASAAVKCLMDLLCDELGAQVGLLIASQMGRPVYARLGWQVLGGTLRCEQPDGPLVWTTAFPDKAAMAFACGGQPLPPGDVDLQGLPW